MWGVRRLHPSGRPKKLLSALPAIPNHLNRSDIHNQPNHRPQPPQPPLLPQPPVVMSQLITEVDPLAPLILLVTAAVVDDLRGSRAEHACRTSSVVTRISSPPAPSGPVNPCSTSHPPLNDDPLLTVSRMAPTPWACNFRSSSPPPHTPCPGWRPPPVPVTPAAAP